jgi:hypothetical protein
MSCGDMDDVGEDTRGPVERDDQSEVFPIVEFWNETGRVRDHSPRANTHSTTA